MIEKENCGYYRTSQNKSCYKTLRTKSDQTIPNLIAELKTILKLSTSTPYSIAPSQDDCQNSIDIIMGTRTRISIRGRSMRYYQQYPNDITIRYNNGHSNSEYHKYLCGKIKAEYFIYYFFDDDFCVKHITIIKPKSIADYLMRTNKLNIITNDDGSSFIAISLFDLLPPGNKSFVKLCDN